MTPTRPRLGVCYVGESCGSSLRANRVAARGGRVPARAQLSCSVDRSHQERNHPARDLRTRRNGGERDRVTREPRRTGTAGLLSDPVPGEVNGNGDVRVGSIRRRDGTGRCHEVHIDGGTPVLELAIIRTETWTPSLSSARSIYEQVYCTSPRVARGPSARHVSVTLRDDPGTPRLAHELAA